MDETGSGAMPVIGILDDCDEPSARMLVVVHKGARGMMFSYLNADLQLSVPRSQVTRGGAMPDHFTPADLFGVEIVLDGDRLIVTQVADSRARYPDRIPRRWQGSQVAGIRVTRGLLDIARQAVTGRQDQPTEVAVSAGPDAVPYPAL